MFSLRTTSSIRQDLLERKSNWGSDPDVIINLKILKKRNALHDERLLARAASYGVPAHIDVFIEAGCDIYEAHYNYGLVGGAVFNGNLTMMRYLLRLGVEPLDALSRLPVYFTRGEIDGVIDELLAAGAIPDRHSSDIFDPLNSGVFRFNPVVVEAWLDRGLDPSYVGFDGNSLDALRLTTFCSEYGKFKYERDVLNRHLSAAIQIIKLLLANGLSLNDEFYEKINRLNLSEKNEYFSRLISFLDTAENIN